MEAQTRKGRWCAGPHLGCLRSDARVFSPLLNLYSHFRTHTHLVAVVAVMIVVVVVVAMLAAVAAAMVLGMGWWWQVLWISPPSFPKHPH